MPTTHQWFLQQLHQDDELRAHVQNELGEMEKGRSPELITLRNVVASFQQAAVAEHLLLTPITHMSFSIEEEEGGETGDNSKSSIVTKDSASVTATQVTVITPFTTKRTAEAIGPTTSSAITEALSHAQLPPSLLRAAVMSPNGREALARAPLLPPAPAITPPVFMIPSEPVQKRYKAAASHKESVECSCHRENFRNANCTFTLCMACCARAHSPSPCRIAVHKAARATLLSQPDAKFFDDAIAAAAQGDRARSVVWISYARGTEGQAPRAIHLTRWAQHGKSIRAICLQKKTGVEQTFLLEHVLRYSVERWEDEN